MLNYDSNTLPKNMGRFLIVNADDFGLSKGVNQGIIESHERGIVTSASLMVRGSFVIEAASYSRKNKRLSLGLHFDVYEWIFKDGNWIQLYEVVSADDASAVNNELSRQLEEFRNLVGRNPTHLDSHQHAHFSDPIQSALIRAGNDLDIPVRHFNQTVKFNGSFYGQNEKGVPYPQGISLESLSKIISGLPIGVTEIGCHPGFINDRLDSVYLIERYEEVKVLCDPSIRSKLDKESVQLISFSDVSQLRVNHL